jgi:hypothetical protein
LSFNIRLFDNWALLVYSIYFRHGHPDITTISQIWHDAYQDGSGSIFFTFFSLLVFCQFLYCRYIFLFILFKLYEMIKPSRVNGLTLDFSFFFRNVFFTMKKIQDDMQHNTDHLSSNQQKLILWGKTLFRQTYRHC